MAGQDARIPAEQQSTISVTLPDPGTRIPKEIRGTVGDPEIGWSAPDDLVDWAFQSAETELQVLLAELASPQVQSNQNLLEELQVIGIEQILMALGEAPEDSILHEAHHEYDRLVHDRQVEIASLALKIAAEIEGMNPPSKGDETTSRDAVAQMLGVGPATPGWNGGRDDETRGASSTQWTATRSSAQQAASETPAVTTLVMLAANSATGLADDSPPLTVPEYNGTNDKGRTFLSALADLFGPNGFALTDIENGNLIWRVEADGLHTTVQDSSGSRFDVTVDPTTGKMARPPALVGSPSGDLQGSSAGTSDYDSTPDGHDALSMSRSAVQHDNPNLDGEHQDREGSGGHTALSSTPQRGGLFRILEGISRYHAAQSRSSTPATQRYTSTAEQTLGAKFENAATSYDIDWYWLTGTGPGTLTFDATSSESAEVLANDLPGVIDLWYSRVAFAVATGDSSDPFLSGQIGSVHHDKSYYDTFFSLRTRQPLTRGDFGLGGVAYSLEPDWNSGEIKIRVENVSSFESFASPVGGTHNTLGREVGDAIDSLGTSRLSAGAAPTELYGTEVRGDLGFSALPAPLAAGGANVLDTYLETGNVEWGVPIPMTSIAQEFDVLIPIDYTRIAELRDSWSRTLEGDPE